MPTRRFYSNTPPQRTLSVSLTSSGTSATISGTFAGWPASFPYFAVLEIGTANAEIVSVTGVAGSVATIVRGQDGTVAVAHAGGATFDQVVIAKDLDEANAHTSANSGVHGISGSVVGTTDAQTLTNKTLTTPTISSPTVTGTLAGASETLSGTLGVTGNATVGGTLGVTGTITSSADVTAGVSAIKLNKPPLAVVYQGVAQALTSAVTTAITMDSEVVDSANGHSTVTNTSRWTCPLAGWYRITGQIAFSANSTGIRVVSIEVNGAALTPGLVTQLASPGAGTNIIQTEGVAHLAVGDYVEIYGQQTSGGSLNTVANLSAMTVQWISD